MNGISAVKGWQQIIPDEYNDWVNQRDDSFYDFIVLGDKKDKSSASIFVDYSQGLLTSRDAWAYNFSSNILSTNMQGMINFFNSEVEHYKKACEKISEGKKLKVEEVISMDSTKISWSSSLKGELSKLKKGKFNDSNIVKGLYRPFQKQWVYYDSVFNHRVSRIPNIFPKTKKDNLVICLTGRGETKGFSPLITDSIPNYHTIATAQCFPLYLYEISENNQIDGDDLFSHPDSNANTYNRKDGISDAGLSHFMATYPNENICKEDIFYYIYGLLHSQEYCERYADNLTKELPRIPCVNTAQDFWAHSKAGRDLAELHINYETVDCYPVKLDKGIKRLSADDYKVTKMKFAKKGDKSAVVYNHNITITNIPLEAYDYVVNGKPALEWVMERQAVTIDKKSGIENDANLWATETMGDAKYPLELFQRVITVSLETMKIVNALPKLDID